MRSSVDEAKLMLFMEEVGKRAKGPGRVYLVGGSTALLLGIRAQTVDIDLKLAPEPAGVFESIAELKEELGLSVELAAPDDFLPPLPGWQDRSELIMRSGPVEFYHYDFYGQCLAKVLRGHQVDVADARAYVSLGKVDPRKLLTLFAEVRPLIIRYPGIDLAQFEAQVSAFVGEDGVR